MEDDIKSGRRESIYHRRITGNNWIYKGSWDKKMERILKEMIFRIFFTKKNVAVSIRKYICKGFLILMGSSVTLFQMS